MKTKPDWFTAQLAGSEIELPDDAKAILEENAENFIRACGSIPFGEWLSLSPESKAAFIVAGERIRKEQSQEIVRLILETLEPAETHDES